MYIKIIIDNKPNEINKNLVTMKIKQPYYTVLNTNKITYRIYPNRSLGIYFLSMIFDLAFKRVRRLFEPWC